MLTPEAVVNEQEAIAILRDNCLLMQQVANSQRLIQTATIAMVCAVISTHPDKALLHQEFGRVWTAIGGPACAVDELLQGGGAVAAAMAAFSEAIGREVP